MFSQLRSVESWANFARGALIGFAVLTLVPALLCTLLAVAFMMFPAAFVCIPFMVPALFPGANKEHANAVRHPYPGLGLAHASAMSV
jgi:hypothetical protein